MEKKVNVKSYIRKGKLVRSYEKNKDVINPVLKTAATATALKLVIDTRREYNKIRGNNLSEVSKNIALGKTIKKQSRIKDTGRALTRGIRKTPKTFIPGVVLGVGLLPIFYKLNQIKKQSTK